MRLNFVSNICVRIIIHLSVCLSAGLSVCPSIYPPICMSACPCVSLPLYVCMRVCVCVCLSVIVSAFMSAVRLSMCMIIVTKCPCVIAGPVQGYCCVPRRATRRRVHPCGCHGVGYRLGHHDQCHQRSTGQVDGAATRWTISITVRNGHGFPATVVVRDGRIACHGQADRHM